MKTMFRFLSGAAVGLLLGWLWGRLNEEELYDDEFDDEVIEINLNSTGNQTSLLEQHA